MLTPTDTHFLVGLLTLISRPDGVDLELGSSVQDSAASEERDVDITVKSQRTDGSMSVYEGLEVKDHSRPLDVTHVEQLWAKLADMPEITERGIVSASGYTEPAVRKAAAHGVTLYALQDWRPPMALGDVFLSDGLKFFEQQIQWATPPRVIFNPSLHLGEVASSIGPDTPVVDRRGEPVAGAPTCQLLAQNIASRVTALARDQEPAARLKVGEKRKVRVDFILEDEPEVRLDDMRIPITEVLVIGEITCVGRTIAPCFKVLVRHDSQELLVGCAVSEMSGGYLSGITVDLSRKVSVIVIPVKDRLLKKIFRRRLT